MTPYCGKCKTTEKSLMVTSTTTLKDGTRKRYYYCNDCNSERMRAYNKKTGFTAAKRAQDKYHVRNPLRRPAWGKAQIIPLEPCQVCGTSEKVHRHHDDPAKPLDVMFLCPLHHKARHRELKAAI